jgi:hypothetical protein
VRFGLASWFRRPCSRAPSHETVFFFALASAFFFSISYVFHGLVVLVVCCCHGGVLVLSPMSKQNPRNKNASVSFFCLLVDFNRWLLCFFVLFWFPCSRTE